MNQEQYFQQMTEYCKNNPNWAKELAEEIKIQRQSLSYKQGLQDGNMRQVDEERCKIDTDYAAGAEEGFRLYMVDCPIVL